MYEVRDGEWLVTTDQARFDVEAIHRNLTKLYWCEGISREVVEEALRGSLCFGLFVGERQVGLARFVTDYATFGYLCDVYVEEGERGKGRGEWMIRAVFAHPLMGKLRRMVLVTRDAHELYRKVGFGELQKPEGYMEVARPGMYLGERNGG